MGRVWLRDDPWARISPMQPGKAGDRGRRGPDDPLIVEVVQWMARTGSPWHDLQAECGA